MNEKEQKQSEFDNFFLNGHNDNPPASGAPEVLNNRLPGLPEEPNVREKLFVLAAFVLGFLMFELVLFGGFGISMTVYVVLFYAAMFWYFSGKPGGIHKQGLPLLIPIGLIAACYTLFDNGPLEALNFLLLIVLIPLQLATMTGNRLYKTFSLGLVIDLFHVCVAVPVINIPAPFKALGRRQAGGKGHGFGQVAIGLGISIPVLAVVLWLLSQADVVFETALSGAFRYLNDNVLEYIGKIILGAFAAVPLFGLMHALRRNKAIGAMRKPIDMARVKVVSPAIVVTVLTTVCLSYAAFIAIQFGYLLNAFSSILPAGFGYADYARRGFFELMGVVCVNLFLLTLSMLFSRRSGLVKAMESALVVLTLFLIASAFSKMVLYMDAYGLTLLRLYTSWFMLLCAVVFVAMLVKVHVPKFALTRFCSVAFVVLFLALNYANVDALIPQYNIHRYETGKAKIVDVETFYDLSDSMIPHAITLLDSEDPKTARMARVLLEERASILNDTRWHEFSVARENAKEVLRARGITYHPRPEGAERTYER